VVIVVFQAVLRLGRKTLVQTDLQLIAVLSFVALFAFNAPFPVVIFTAALYGFSRSKPNQATPVPAPHAPKLTAQGTIIQAALWLSLWFAPVAITYVLGYEQLSNIGVFFSKLATVSFGGAYAVLAYMAQEAVNTHYWLSPAQMMDGLGLAETTPGPLILVTQFVGFSAGYGISGPGFALLACAMPLWTTFIPCFLWIFVAAPHVEWLTSRPRLNTALRAITASVVGVIANLSLWFSLHVFFTQASQLDGFFSPSLPVFSSINPPAIGWLFWRHGCF
jgi:chromate transporter